MVENFFWTFLLITVICFLLVAVSKKVDKFKFRDTRDYIIGWCLIFTILTIAFTIGWIWS